MSTPLRLIGFAVVVVLAFGGAALAGSLTDPRPGEESGARPMPAHADDMHAGHGAGAADEPQAVRGLTTTQEGQTLELTRTTAPRGARATLAFRIVGEDGATVRAFDVEHTKRMHVIVVRRDLSGFQHVHPVQREDGSWAVSLTLPDAGSHRVFADFSSGGVARTLAADLTVDGALRTRALPASADRARVDGYDVALDHHAALAGVKAPLTFTVTRDGAPVALRDHLGAKGHLVALRTGDLAFLHVHPDADRLRFHASFPSAGTYRLFLQFKTTDGRVHTTAFTHAIKP